MSQEPITLRNEALPWAPTGGEADEAALGDAAWWLTGSASLVLWTAIALLLTAV